MKLNHPSISTGQDNQFVSLLPSAPEPRKSPRDNKICEVMKSDVSRLERYCKDVLLARLRR